MDGQLFTWLSIASMGGASLLTFITIQLFKRSLDRLVQHPTDLLAAIVGFFWILVANLALGANPADWRVYLLNLANGMLVGLASGKMHDLVLRPPGTKGNNGGNING